MMSSWTERMHRRAATLGNVVTSCGHPSSVPPYPRRLEKSVLFILNFPVFILCWFIQSFVFCRVKFGVPLDEVCKNDIPGPLLVSFCKFLFFFSKL